VDTGHVYWNYKTQCNNQQTAPSAAQQTAPRAAQQTASGAAQQTAPRAAQQTASGAAQQTASGAAQQTAPRAAQQTAPGAAQQNTLHFKCQLLHVSTPMCHHQGVEKQPTILSPSRTLREQHKIHRFPTAKDIYNPKNTEEKLSRTTAAISRPRTNM